MPDGNLRLKAFNLFLVRGWTGRALGMLAAGLLMFRMGRIDLGDGAVTVWINALLPIVLANAGGLILLGGFLKAEPAPTEK